MSSAIFLSERFCSCCHRVRLAMVHCLTPLQYFFSKAYVTCLQLTASGIRMCNMSVSQSLWPHSRNVQVKKFVCFVFFIFSNYARFIVCAFCNVYQEIRLTACEFCNLDQGIRFTVCEFCSLDQGIRLTARFAICTKGRLPNSRSCRNLYPCVHWSPDVFPLSLLSIII